MKKTILWDFDGVILESNKVRELGFRQIFKDFDQEMVEKLLKYHRYNGGLSRYVKIRFFFEDILSRSISDEDVIGYAQQFSVLMRKELTNPINLISDSVEFIKKNYGNYNFHIVSGSDNEELRFLCKQLLIDQFFVSINGSPTPKKQLVENIINEYKYNLEKTCLIGDSINDYEAAFETNIDFYGYNNKSLLSFGNYIDSFNKFNF